MRFKTHAYQLTAHKHQMKFPESGLFLDMGLGKTAITLLTLKRLLFDTMQAEKVLIIAPAKVVDNVWIQERDKWEDFKYIDIVRVVGTEKQRKQILRERHDVYVISRDLVSWLVSYYGGAFPFDTGVIDELSSFKSPKSNRFRDFRRVRPKLKRMMGLTGTPMPNGIPDLWSQMYLLDMGERLGNTLGGFRDLYLKEGQKKGHVVYNWNVKTPSKEDAEVLGEDIYSRIVYDRIGDICISMKAEDYLDMPKRLERIVNVELSPKIKKLYDDFEEELILNIDPLTDITALNAAALTGKLCQFANGAVYDDKKAWHEVHREKIIRLDEIIDTATGNVLIGYWFKHDRERILSQLKKYKIRQLSTPADMVLWNKGRIKAALLHPKSGGHGLNLQYGGNTVAWFGLPNYSLELKQQFDTRIYRQGLRKPFISNHLIARGTIDEDMMQAFKDKDTRQSALMRAVKALKAKYQQ